MAKSFKEWEKGMRAPAVTKSYIDRLTSDNLSTGDKVKHMLDPQQVFIKDIPQTDKEIKQDDLATAKWKTKQKRKRLAKSRAYGAPYKKGGQVKSKSCCRGMGCATRGGRFHKDG